MGQTDGLNNPAPPKFIERLVARALPRDCREHVLGDLHERYTSPIGYLADAASVVPAMILSRVRRATPLPFLLLETLLVYAGFLAAAYWSRKADGPPNAWEAASFTAIVMAGLLWKDAYSGPLTEPGFRPTPYSPPHPDWPPLWSRVMAQVYLTVYFSCGLRTFWWLAWPHQLHPMVTTIRAGCIASILISPLRIWLDAIREDRPRRAR